MVRRGVKTQRGAENSNFDRACAYPTYKLMDLWTLVIKQAQEKIRIDEETADKIDLVWLALMPAACTESPKTYHYG